MSCENPDVQVTGEVGGEHQFTLLTETAKVMFRDATTPIGPTGPLHATGSLEFSRAMFLVSFLRHERLAVTGIASGQTIECRE